jgi:hypothetical protein
LLCVLALGVVQARAQGPAGKQPIAPRDKTIELCNGKDFTGLYTFLKGRDQPSVGARRREPDDVYRVEDGMIHISGEGAGYVATENEYRDYHLAVEYKWGKRNDGSGYVRNAGVLVHGTGPDGSAGGTWMACLEVQLAQGCEGDLIVIRGKDEKGKVIPVDISSEVRIAEDGKTRWQAGGKKVRYSGKQFWWSRHEPFFKEKLDTRGHEDAASPVGEWTRVEVICAGSRVTVKINGVTVNEAVDVWPGYGKILLQNEGNEIYYRNFRLLPLEKEIRNPKSETNPNDRKRKSKTSHRPFCTFGFGASDLFRISDFEFRIYPLEVIRCLTKQSRQSARRAAIS